MLPTCSVDARCPDLRCYDNATYTGHRYCLNTTKSSFNEAQSSCNLLGGHLVAYQDMHEQRWVASLTATGAGWRLGRWLPKAEL